MADVRIEIEQFNAKFKTFQIITQPPIGIVESGSNYGLSWFVGLSIMR